MEDQTDRGPEAHTGMFSGDQGGLQAARNQEPSAADPEGGRLLRILTTAANIAAGLQSVLAAEDGFKPAQNADADDPFRGVVPERGDILAVSRKGGIYQHFGVYAGGGRVVHFAADNGDFGGRISIHEASLDTFRGQADRIFVVDFPQDGTRRTADNESPLFDLLMAGNYHLYSPEETVERAYSRIGEGGYNLPVKNCEHFALWCKTGVSESRQVNAWATRIAAWIRQSRKQ